MALSMFCGYSARRVIAALLLVAVPALLCAQENTATLSAGTRLAVGKDRILGFVLRPEVAVDYMPFGFLALRAGAATEFRQNVLDSAYIDATFSLSWGWFRVDAGSGLVLTIMPFTGYANLSVKPLLSLQFPFLELAAGINYRSYPTGLWDAEFLFRVALFARLAEDRLLLRLSLSDFSDFTEGSLATFGARFEAGYNFGDFELGVDLDVRTAGTIAFSGTMSRLLLGFGAKWRII